jgi:RNA polymerase sigma-70 factor (ECF subfamily)
VILQLSNDDPALAGLGQLASEEPGAAAAAPSARMSPRLLGAVQRHHQLVWRTLRRLGVPERDADDAAQQVFWIFAQRAAVLDVRQDEHFLLAVAIRVAANARRKLDRGREISAGEIEAACSLPNPESLLQQKQLREKLDVGLATLPLEQRAIFVLFEIEGYSLPEIAETLNIPLGTATSRLRRARGHFDAWLRENQLGEEP